MVIAWLDFGEVLLETLILAFFLLTFRMCFFKVKHYFGHIAGMVGPIDAKRKGSAFDMQPISEWIRDHEMNISRVVNWNKGNT